MIFEKIITLFDHYLYKDNSDEEMLEFQKQFEVIFDLFRKEIKLEIGEKKYELLDDIYMIFDLYESNEEIRSNEPYCLDKAEVTQRIKDKYQKITIS